MSINLHCNKMDLFQTPTDVTLWCIDGDYSKWKNADRFWKQALNEGKYEPIYTLANGGSYSFTKRRYIEWLLLTNLPAIELRRNAKGKKYWWVDPLIFNHIKKLHSLGPDIEWSMR